MVLEDVVGQVGFAIIDGRAPERAGEIALGTETLDEAGLSVGDRVDLRGRNSETYETPHTVATIVGRGVFPNVTEYGRLGEGAAVTEAGARVLNPVYLPSTVFVDLAGRSTVPEVVDALSEATGLDFRAVPPAPGLLDDVERVADLPLLMAGAMSLAAAALLLHALVTSVRRRGPDLAVLRTMGLVGRQLRAAIGWQAVTIAAIAVIVAIPLGIVVGRLAWLLHADAIGVVPEAIAPHSGQLLAVPAVLLGAFVVGALVGVGPARRRPVLALRAE